MSRDTAVCAVKNGFTTSLSVLISSARVMRRFLMGIEDILDWAEDRVQAAYEDYREGDTSYDYYRGLRDMLNLLSDKLEG
jgi:hypothetical protein